MRKPNIENYQKDLEELAAYDSSVEVTPENRGIGSLVIHMLTAPYIEVAEDGKTAQGLWYSPGAVGGGFAYRVRMPFPSPSPKDGKGGAPADMPPMPGGDQNEDIPGMMKKKPDASPAAQSMVEPATPGPMFTDWTKLTVPQPVPIPEPYKTDSEVWHYCDNPCLEDD